MTSPKVAILVPSIDNSGPVNLAVDLAVGYRRAGFAVEFLYLKKATVSHAKLSGIPTKKFDAGYLFRFEGAIHSHCLVPDLIAGFFKLLKRRLVVISTVPSFIYFDMRLQYGYVVATVAWRLWRVCTSVFDAKVVLNDTMVRYFKKADKAYRYTRIFHSRRASSCVDPRDRDRIRTFLNPDQVGLVFVGGLTPRKNILPLLKSITRDSQTQCVVFGEGPLRPAVEVLAREYPQKILYLGFRQQLEGVYSEFDGLVLPSLAEGFPTVVLEALREDVPCLLSNIAVHREISRRGLGVKFNHRSFADFTRRAVELKLLKRSDEFKIAVLEANQVVFNADRRIADYIQLIKKQGR